MCYAIMGCQDQRLYILHDFYHKTIFKIFFDKKDKKYQQQGKHCLNSPSNETIMLLSFISRSTINICVPSL